MRLAAREKTATETSIAPNTRGVDRSMLPSRLPEVEVDAFLEEVWISLLTSVDAR
jgi:hypothetical protein